MAEYAKGIPKKHKMSIIPSVKGRRWKFGIQRHEAKRAGKHYDIRLSDGHKAYSWAARHLPKPGEKKLAIRQSDHTPEYMNYRGVLLSGYGAGKVSRHHLGDIEVVKSSPDKIIFNSYPGKDTEEYALIKTTGNRWIFMNNTPTDRIKVPNSKPKYKEIKPNEVSFNNDSVMQAKLDGAHVTYLLKKDKPIKAFSYRPSAKRSGPIQHTDRIKGLRYKKVPKKLDDTIVRGELLAVKNNSNKAIPAHKIGGLLNSNVWKSRDTQDKNRVSLRNYIFDVVKFRGKDYDKKSYLEKRKVLKLISRAMPSIFKLPPEAITESDKKKLFNKIKNNRLPETKEGVILWDLASSKAPTKIKFKPEFDVLIHDIFTKPRSKALMEAGGFNFNRVNDKKINVLSRVGTGFSKRLRKDMYKNPNKYKGIVAKVTALEQLPSGALRSPSFSSWHLDKNRSSDIPDIEK